MNVTKIRPARKARTARPEKVLLYAYEAAAVLSVCVETLRDMRKAGLIAPRQIPVRQGRFVLRYHVDDLRRVADDLQAN